MNLRYLAFVLALIFVPAAWAQQSIGVSEVPGDRPVIALPDGDEWAIATRAEKPKESPDMDMLLRVSLPPNPTRSEVINYVNVIYMLSRRQRTELPGDPQVTMLAKVGREHLDVLLASSAPGVPMAKYGIHAIALLVQAEDQQWVFDHLPANHGLVTVIQLKGWCEAARPIFESLLARGPRNVSLDVIECLLQKPKPEYYAALKLYFVTASNAHSAYGLLRTIPGLDLRAELPQAWEYSRSDGNPYAVSYLAPDVLATGYLPAFHFLFEALECEVDGRRRIATFDAGTMIRRYSFASGSRDEMLAWYAVNKYSLRFDRKSARFVAGRSTK
jgi:hypothetical protein